MTSPTDVVIDAEPKAVPAPEPAKAVPTAPSSRWLVAVVGAVAVIALAVSVLLWQKLSRIQEQLARQSTKRVVQYPNP